MARQLHKTPLWDAAGQTSAEEVLEADIAASLLALLRQIAGLVEHSAEVFGSIQEEVCYELYFCHCIGTSSCTSREAQAGLTV